MPKLSDTIPGLNIDRLLFSFSHIRQAWSEYFWNSKVCKARVRFTEEEKSNYIADALAYFEDTIYLLANFRTNENYRSALYDTMAVLQLMYVQQDLLEELMKLFNLKTDVNLRNEVRFLRNELIGHPISRNSQGKLKWSVFITGETKGETLQYVRYYGEKGYSQELKTLKWPDLFRSHEQFLQIHFDKILSEVDETLKLFKSKLNDVLLVAPSLPIIDLAEKVEINYESFHKNVHPYSVENIIIAAKSHATHKRYEYTTELYRKYLIEALHEKMTLIDEFIARDFIARKKNDDFPNVEIKINYVSVDHIATKIAEPEVEDLSYAFSKISNFNHPFGPSYFRSKFMDDAEVMAELENMMEPGTAEFHISYEYLKQLLIDRGHLPYSN